MTNPSNGIERVFVRATDRAAHDICIAAVEHAPAGPATVGVIGQTLLAAAGIAWMDGIDTGLSIAEQDPDAARALLAWYRAVPLEGQEGISPDPVVAKLIDAVNASKEV